MEVTLEKEAHVYTDEKGRVIPGITTILTEARMLDTAWFTDVGKARGSAVHAACHYLDEGDLDLGSVDPQIQGYVRAWEKFVRESAFIPSLIEHVVWSDTYRFAATLDRFGIMNGNFAVIEIKTGEVEPWAGVQTAAQMICLLEQNYAPVIQKRGAVRLRKDGTYRWNGFEDEGDIQAALGAVAVYHWKRNHNIKGA